MEEERRHASPEGLRSEKDAVSIIKHGGNEKSTTNYEKVKGNLLFLFLSFIFIVFSQSIFSRLDTLLCVFCNRSYRVMFCF